MLGKVSKIIVKEVKSSLNILGRRAMTFFWEGVLLYVLDILRKRKREKSQP